MLQIGTPVEIYEQPASRFIAEFIGDSNMLEAEIAAGERCRLPGRPGRGAGAGATSRGAGPVAGAAVHLLLRPEMIRLAPAASGETPKLAGRIEDEVYQGSLRRYRVRAGRHDILVEVPNRPELGRLSPGDPVELYWSEESSVVVP